MEDDRPPSSNSNHARLDFPPGETEGRLSRLQARYLTRSVLFGRRIQTLLIGRVATLTDWAASEDRAQVPIII